MAKLDDYKMTVADGHPRSLLDKQRKRFTGGGVSSSIDLAFAILLEIGDDVAYEFSKLNLNVEGANKGCEHDQKRALKIGNSAALMLQVVQTAKQL